MHILQRESGLQEKAGGAEWWGFCSEPQVLKTLWWTLRWVRVHGNLALYPMKWCPDVRGWELSRPSLSFYYLTSTPFESAQSPTISRLPASKLKLYHESWGQGITTDWQAAQTGCSSVFQDPPSPSPSPSVFPTHISVIGSPNSDWSVNFDLFILVSGKQMLEKRSRPWLSLLGYLFVCFFGTESQYVTLAGICYEDHAGLKPRDPPTSASQMLGLKSCHGISIFI